MKTAYKKYIIQKKWKLHYYRMQVSISKDLAIKRRKYKVLQERLG